MSERLYIPSTKLRGFESGKVGPKDGNDFIGGNFMSRLMLQLQFHNYQTQDIDVSFDAQWGVDYDSSINDGSKLRSSIGFAVDWFTIGP